MADNKRESIGGIDESKRRGCENDTCYCTGACTKGTTKSAVWNPFKYSGGDNEVSAVDVGDKSSDILVKLDVDVSEALTGLKAIQREAKEATKVLRVLETQGNVVNVMRAGSRELIASVGEHEAIIHNDYEVEYGEKALLADITSFTPEELIHELSGRKGVMHRKVSDIVSSVPEGFTLIVEYGE